MTLVGYSIYMISEAKGISVLSGIVLGLGVIDSSLGLLLSSCGYSSLFYLRLYAFIVGLLELAQICIAILFLVPSTQQRIIDTINPPADLKTKIEANLAISGWVLLAVVAFQGLTLVLVLAQQCVLDRGFDESEFDQESLLGSSSSSKSKKSKSKGGKDRFGAIDDEVASTAAAGRYKEKASRYYEKYGLK